MMISPAPAQHASSRRPNTLRITPPLAAISAVMNGVDPDPEHVAALADTTISAETLHLAAAAALRQVMRPLLLARQAGGGQGSARLENSTLFDAYYLAVDLANGGDSPPRISPDKVDAALLIGSMQVRFLETLCSQIEIGVVTPKLQVAGKASARSVLQRGGVLAAGVRLLPDHSGSGAAEGVSWLHAMSTITVAGVEGSEVVDAGPDNATAQWVARLAAPVTISAAGGMWPVTAVEDCLRISAQAVRRWVAAMPRELCGEGGRDIMLRSGPALRDFLVSPATVAMTGETGGGDPLPLKAEPVIAKPRRGVLSSMRAGGVAGTELGPDVVLRGGVRAADIHRDELAVLAAAAETEFPEEVQVTVNLPVPEWKDLSALADEVRENGGFILTAPVLAWAERDVVVGQRSRFSLRARVRRGVVCHTGQGDGVLLPVGTKFSILGMDTGKGHFTFYASQVEPQPPQRDSETEDAA